MLEYKGGNHGLFKTVNMKDYMVRMKEFFDFYLMDKPAPKLNDELEARQKETKKTTDVATEAVPHTVQ